MTDIFKLPYRNSAEQTGEGIFGKFIEKFGEIVFPFLLCVTMMSAGEYIYTENILDVYTIISVLWCAGAFALFGKIRKMKHGGLLYFAALIMISFVPNIIMPSWRDKVDFVQWFFSGGQAVATRANFMLTFIVLFGFFFCSVIYYFTRVIYRSAAVVLISLIPLALSVKAVSSMPGYFPFILASLDMVIFIFYSRKKLIGKSISNGKSTALIVYSDFAVAAVLLALIAPKPSETPFYDKFEAFMNRFQFGGTGETVMQGDYSQYSGNADDLLRQESILLYVISSTDPTYMKTQVFDIYDNENNRWTSLSENINGSRKWSEAAQLLNFEKLDAAFEKADEYSGNFYEEHPAALMLDGISETESFSVVYSREFPAVYVLAPLRTTRADISSTGAFYTARSEAGEIFTNMARLPATSNYTVRYYSENVFYNGLLDGGACDITIDEYEDMLRDAVYSLENEGSSDELAAANAFLDECVKAREYSENTKTEVSPKIQALADELTSGLEYDHQKAAAIEQYFQSNGFIYSLAYQAPEDSDTAEYFIFESKTGTCSDFATAFTLLARAAGLTVRYAEGFVPTAGDDPAEGLYYIYTENAHAYPEVYIPGAGWVIYEPTVSGGASNGSDTDGNNDIDTLTVVFTAIVVVIALGVFLLLMIFKRRINEGFFRLGLRFADDTKAVKVLYRRLSKTVGAKYETRHDAMTAEELSAFVKEKTGIPAEPLTECFSEVCYGGKTASKEQRDAAYECYKNQIKELFGKNKKNKK